MNLLKSETEERYRENASNARDDVPMYPEQLCDYDILMWRKDGHLYTGRHAETGVHTYLQHARENDFEAPSRDVNDRVKTFAKTSTQIHRNFT